MALPGEATEPIERCFRIHTTVPNSLPTTAVRPMASAPQNATRAEALNDHLSTKDAREEDRMTLTVRSPSQNELGRRHERVPPL